MTWNHRVVEFGPTESSETYHEIREVFYNPDGTPWGHGSASLRTYPQEEDDGGWPWIQDMVAKAIAAPVLKESDFVAHVPVREGWPIDPESTKPEPT